MAGRARRRARRGGVGLPSRRSARIMATRDRFRVARAIRSAVSPALTPLIAELCGARELARRTDSLIVTDPAPGAGDLLAAVAHVLGPDCTPMFAGAERRPGPAGCRRRLTVPSHAVGRLDTGGRASGGRVGGDSFQPSTHRVPVQPRRGVGGAASGRGGRVCPGPPRPRPRPSPPCLRRPRARADLSRATWWRPSSGCPARCHFGRMRGPRYGC